MAKPQKPEAPKPEPPKEPDAPKAPLEPPKPEPPKEPEGPLVVSDPNDTGCVRGAVLQVLEELKVEGDVGPLMGWYSPCGDERWDGIGDGVILGATVELLVCRQPEIDFKTKRETDETKDIMWRLNVAIPGAPAKCVNLTAAQSAQAEKALA